MTGGLSHKPGIVLRVSVTDRCNFRCEYCKPAGSKAHRRFTPLSLGELTRLVGWLHERYPVRTLKITGGEPTVRRGLVEWIGALQDLGIEEISMTTNGSRLAAAASSLARAGLKRVNISLDTLDPSRFTALSGGDISRTLAGIEAAREAGLAPIKLNSVLHRTSWRQDVPELLDFAANRGLQPRFIELMRTGLTAAWAENEFIPADTVLGWLADRTELAFRPQRAGQPARLVDLHWGGRRLLSGWITPYSNAFCHGCDRLRLDSAGRLHRCLMDPQPFPLAERLAAGDETAAAAGVDTYLAGKRAPLGRQAARSMAALGG